MMALVLLKSLILDGSGWTDVVIAPTVEFLQV